MNTTNKKTVLIAGASGVLGKALINHFSDKGYTVYGLVRNASSVPELTAMGVLLKEADMSQPGSLTGVCEGIDVVIPAVHAMLGKGRNVPENVDWQGHAELIKQAADSGVKHFIYPSVYNASAEHPLDFFRIKYRVEQQLKSSSIPYTIFRLPAFMEWHAWRLIGKDIKEKGKASIFGSGNNPINFISAQDIAKAIDQVVLNPSWYGSTLQLSGPDNMCRNEIAELYAKRFSKSIKITRLPVGVLKIMAPVIKIFHPGIARIMRFAMHTENTDETRPASESISQFGLQPTRLKDFVMQYAD